MKIGLVQINSRFEDQVYLPYSAALLQAAAQRQAREPHRFDFLPTLYTRLPVAESVRQLADADAVFFSVYVWNQNLSLAIARGLKDLDPEKLIVFGGPQVPDDAEKFLRENRCIDLVCHGEGEKTFVRLLDGLEQRRWNDLDSISFLHDGAAVQTARAKRTTDLSCFPSPYLDGTFDPLIKAHPHEKWIALWETSRGCPFSCTFCDWGSAVHARVHAFDMDRLVKELEWFARQKVEFVYCADANFGILPRDLEVAKAAADMKRIYGFPRVISIQNTKNVTDRAYEIQKVFSLAGLSKGATLSLQSMEPRVLSAIRRSNISTNSFRELQRRFQREEIKTYTDIILGLPGETYQSFADGISWAIENGQHNHIQFNTLSLLPNAEISETASREKHGLETVESRLINIHGTSASAFDDVPETQSLVIATNTLPRNDWVRARVFWWTVSLLHFDKLLQIPFVAMRNAAGVPYRRLVDVFCEGSLTNYPLLAEIRDFFFEKARRIQTGEPEYCRSERWLNIWWPADELVMIRLFTEGRLDQFYAEATDLLQTLISAETPRRLVSQAVLLNRALLKMPGQTRNAELTLSLNLWSYYKAALRGAPVAIEERDTRISVDRTSAVWKSWTQWCREVVWYGSKNGSYLYEGVFESETRRSRPATAKPAQDPLLPRAKRNSSTSRERSKPNVPN